MNYIQIRHMLEFIIVDFQKNQARKTTYSIQIVFTGLFEVTCNDKRKKLARYNIN